MRRTSGPAIPNQAGKQWNALAHTLWRGRMYYGFGRTRTAEAHGVEVRKGDCIIVRA